MANQRLTDKSAADFIGTGDLFMVVDVSDTTGSAAGTSKKLDSKYVIMTDKISVSNAELQDLRDNAKTLVSAPGAGYMITPISVACLFDYGSSADGLNTSVYVGFVRDVNAYWKRKDRVMRSITADATYYIDVPDTTNIGIGGDFPEDLPLLMYSSVDFDSTDLTCDVYVTYNITKVF